MATALSRSPLYVRGGHLHTNQCSTFTGMILVFGVIDSFRVVFVLLLVECLMWYAKVVQKSSTVYTNFIHSALGATAGSAPQKPRRGCPIGYLVVVLMEGQPPAVASAAASGWTSRAWASVRGGACVSAMICQADPRRKCHYTPVPDTYREEQQLDDDACVCSSNFCHR